MKITVLKNKNGLINLLIGLLLLIGCFLVYKFITKDELLIFILVTFSIILLVYGIFQFIRDSLQ